jgi:phage tail-like protein
MAVPRQYPYNQFNFQVQFGPGNQASFQEISGLGMEIHVAEYRSGDGSSASTGDPNSPIKVTGLAKYNDVTLKRGVIGNVTDLYPMFTNVAAGKTNGPSGSSGGQSVTINLMDDTNTTVVQTWVLANARVIKHTGPTFNGKATDVAIEEIVLTCEGIKQQ